MPTVVIKHEARAWIREGLTVLLDGRDYGTLEPCSKKGVVVDPGRHQIWLASKIATSPIVTFDADAREEYGFVCQTSGLVKRRITLQTAYVRKPSNRFEKSEPHAGARRLRKATSHGKNHDHWSAVLGVHPESPLIEVRQAYLRLIGIYHPDRVGHLPHAAQILAHEEARRINLAYQAAKSTATAAR